MLNKVDEYCLECRIVQRMRFYETFCKEKEYGTLNTADCTFMRLAEKWAEIQWRILCKK